MSFQDERLLISYEREIRALPFRPVPASFNVIFGYLFLESFCVVYFLAVVLLWLRSWVELLRFPLLQGVSHENDHSVYCLLPLGSSTRIGYGDRFVGRDNY